MYLCVNVVVSMLIKFSFLIDIVFYGDDGSRTRVLTSSSKTLITCVVRLTTSTNERTHVLKYHLPFKTYLQAWACSSQKGEPIAYLASAIGFMLNGA